VRGTITVAAAREGHSIRFSVLDDGCGIPEAQLERIFKPLVTTKRNGTGLGLPIARRLIESHGGTLRAGNRDGGGAAFHCFLPVSGFMPVASERSKGAAAQPARVPGVKRILLVEDDPSVGAGIEAVLSQEGFEIEWVRVAAQACDAARRMSSQVA